MNCLSQIIFTHRIIITAIEYNNYKKTVKILNVKYNLFISVCNDTLNYSNTPIKD